MTSRNRQVHQPQSPLPLPSRFPPNPLLFLIHLDPLRAIPTMLRLSALALLEILFHLPTKVAPPARLVVLRPAQQPLMAGHSHLRGNGTIHMHEANDLLSPGTWMLSMQGLFSGAEIHDDKHTWHRHLRVYPAPVVVQRISPRWKIRGTAFLVVQRNSRMTMHLFHHTNPKVPCQN